MEENLFKKINFESCFGGFINLGFLTVCAIGIYVLDKGNDQKGAIVLSIMFGYNLHNCIRGLIDFINKPNAS